MIRLILGLGNPGKEYERTRHNAGRAAAEYFVKKIVAGEFEFDKKSNCRRQSWENQIFDCFAGNIYE